jgi:hypothetical protein
MSWSRWRIAVLGASVVLQGSRLGKLIEGVLPENKGKMKIGGVSWRLRALVDIITDEPSPIALDGLQIIDPEGRSCSTSRTSTRRSSCARSSAAASPSTICASRSRCGGSRR